MTNQRKRTIANENRKRALYSCDRCKLRKTKCRRLAPTEVGLIYDNTTPCVECSKSGVLCTTTIPRKKRQHEYQHLEYPKELEEHYRSLHAIVSHLYPETNVDDLSALRNLEKRLGIWQETEGPVREATPDSTKHGSTEPAQDKYQSLLYDQEGNQHYIGPGGTGSVLKGLIDIIQSRTPHNRRTSLSSSSTTPMNTASPRTLGAPLATTPAFDMLRLERFPLVNLLLRTEYHHYFAIFLDKVLPFHYVFRKAQLEDHFNLLMNEFFDHKPEETPLVPRQICMLYIVLLFGRKYEETPHPGTRFTQEVADQYMDIIRLFLSEHITTPSIGGIKLLFMVAKYLNEDATRESAYVLANITYVQARSLGLHRESIVLRFQSLEKQDDCRQLFWTLYRTCETMAVTFGRSSFIQHDDFEIDVAQPSLRFAVLCRDPGYCAYLKKELLMGPLVSGILHNRRLLVTNSILSPVNVERNLEMTDQLHRFKDSWPLVLTNYENDTPIRRYKLKLHNAHANQLSMIALPFLLESAHATHPFTPSIPLLKIIRSGIDAALCTSRVLSFAQERNLLNATVYYDRLYGYTAFLVLVFTFLLVTTPGAPHILDGETLEGFHNLAVSPAEMLEAITRLRSSIESMRGSGSPGMAKIAVVMSNLAGDLNITEELEAMVQAGRWRVKSRAALISLPTEPVVVASLCDNLPDQPVMSFFDDQWLDSLFGDNFMTGTNSTSFNLGGLFDDFTYE